MEQEVSFDSASLCCFADDIRSCGSLGEPAALTFVAIAVASALHPRILAGALKLVGEPAAAVRRLGIPESRAGVYERGLVLLSLLAAAWILAGLYDGPGSQRLWDWTRPALLCVVALVAGATLGGMALLVGLAQHTLERRLGAGYASLLLGSSAIGTALSVAIMSSLHVLSLIGGAIVGAAILALYRAVDGLPWYAAVAGSMLGALLGLRDLLQT